MFWKPHADALKQERRPVAAVALGMPFFNQQRLWYAEPNLLFVKSRGRERKNVMNT